MTIVQSGPTSNADASAHYYLIIDGLDGGSLSDKFTHAFEISDFSFSIDAIAAASGGGSGIGKPVFNPLDVEFSSGSAADDIARLLLTGRTVPGVRLVGIGDSPDARPFLDLRLGEVKLGAFEQTATGDHLSLSYARVTVSTQDDKGAMQTTGWDIPKGVALTTPLTAPVGADEDAPPTAGPLTWYLTIDGLDGGSTAAGHEGAFEFVDFDFQMLQAIASGGGGSVGKVELDPLALKFGFGSAAEEILGLVASSKTIGAAQLVGVNQETAVTEYDLRLGNIKLKTADLRTGMDALSIDYSKFSLTTTNASGIRETLSFDRPTQVAGTSELGAATASDENASNSGDDARFFLAIQGLDGGSTAKGHKGAFEITGFDIDLANQGIDLTGAGSGKTKFSPLDIDFMTGTDANRLLQMVASGKTIGSVQISGDEMLGGKLVTSSFDLRLADVNLRSFLESGTGDHLSLAYKKFTLTTTGEDGLKETSGWDIGATTGLTAPLARPKVGLHDAASGGSMDYYLVIAGMDGGSRVAGHQGAFEVDDLHFNVRNSGGKPSFSTLDLELQFGSAAEDLILLAARDRKVASIQLVGDTTGDDPQTVYDLRLGKAQIAAIDDTGIGNDQLSFRFGSYSLATLDDNGKRSFSGFDLADQSRLATEIAAPRRAAADGVGPQKLDYYMTMNGLDGGSASDRHAGSFELDDLHFKINRGAGLASLSVDLDLGSASDELLAMIASGNKIAALQIVGEVHGAEKSNGPYDLRLGNVGISGIDHNGDGKDSIELTFNKYSLTTRNGAGVANTSGFDFTSATALDKQLAAATSVRENAQAGGSQTYHLLIDGLDGGDRQVTRAGAFAIDGFDFDVKSVTSPSGGGAGVAKAVFQPIEIHFDAGSAGRDLLLMAAKGLSIGAVQIVGDGSGEQAPRNFDLRLADVHITHFEEGGQDYRLTLSFDALSLTTANQANTGAITKETFHFDIATSETDAVALPPADPFL